METIQILDKKFDIYINNDQIKNKIIDLAKVIDNDFLDKDPIFLGILNGSFMFAAELFQHLSIKCSISFLKLSSYDGTESSGKMNQLIGINEDIKNRNIVILEDIIDTGNTLKHIVEELEKYDPNEIKIASLLYKPEAYNNLHKIDYYAFSIPNEFIVGYGLDYCGYGRNLKHIYKIK